MSIKCAISNCISGSNISGNNISGNIIGGSVDNNKQRMQNKRADRDYNDSTIKDLKLSPRSKSEARVIKYLEDITHESFPTIYPHWLIWMGARLELDGYCERLNCAMEFSGPLHTKWTPSKEPYTKYFARIVRDVVKRNTCKKRGVHFFTIDCSLPSIHWRNYVLSRLSDFGIASIHINLYIPEQIILPFRNEQIEHELGLQYEMELAENIGK